MLSRPSLMVLASLGLILRLTSAASTLCPSVDSIGHAETQQWTFSNLNWTLIQGEDTEPLVNGSDISRVTFDIKSPFNDASFSCDVQGAEFTEEYIRKARGASVSYSWYNCTGTNDKVQTQIRLVWWDTHLLEIRQTWQCDQGDRSSIPMRATGQENINKIGFNCTYSKNSARLHCWSTSEQSLPISATTVRVLPPPTRNCAAASQAPKWKVLDWKWIDGFTASNIPWSAPQQNMTFRVVNEALDGYSPRMNCTPAVFNMQAGWEYATFFKCDVFEANVEDVPETSFNWMKDEMKLTINQTWWCADDQAPNKRKTFNSLGSMNVTPFVKCSTFTLVHEKYRFNDTVKSCTATSEFEIPGTLKPDS